MLPELTEMLETLYPWLAGCASMLILAGFAFSNVKLLRGLNTLGAFGFVIYLLLRDPVRWPTLWLAMLFFVAMAAVNIYHLALGAKRGGKFLLSGEEMMLFSRLPGLTPQEYKALLDISEWHTPNVSMALTKLGEMPKALYYVLEGKAEVNRGGKRFSIGPHAFIGELAFLRSKPATATTFANVGALIVSWEQVALRELMKSNDGVRKAFDTMLSIDLAEKMAKSATPHLQEQST